MSTVNRLCLLVAVILLARCEDPVPDSDQSPAFDPEEKFQDMFPLTRENFTKKVLLNKDPWIVIFHDGSIERAWKTMATHLRGLCWIGMIDTRNSESLLKEIVSTFFTFINVPKDKKTIGSLRIDFKT